MNKYRRRLIVLLFLTAAAIVPIVMAQRSDEEDSPHTHIVYLLEWEWGDAVPDLVGTGWSIVNDLGYQIHVADGYLVNYSAELLSCEPASVTDWLQPQTAYAGHGGEPGESRTTEPLRESLAEPTAVTLQRRAVEITAYCQLHYLVGQHDETAPYTLSLSGSYIAPGEETAVPFSIQTDIGWGDVVPLPDTLATTEMDALVAIQRDLSHLFDDIQLDADEKSDIEKSLLRNLITHTRIVVN